MVDVKSLEAKAKEEIAKEIEAEAIKKLKELYRSREKAMAVLRNIDREIAAYLADCQTEVAATIGGEVKADG